MDHGHRIPLSRVITTLRTVTAHHRHKETAAHPQSSLLSSGCIYSVLPCSANFPAARTESTLDPRRPGMPKKRHHSYLKSPQALSPASGAGKGERCPRPMHLQSPGGDRENAPSVIQRLANHRRASRHTLHHRQTSKVRQRAAHPATSHIARILFGTGLRCAVSSATCQHSNRAPSSEAYSADSRNAFSPPQAHHQAQARQRWSSPSRRAPSAP